MAINKKSFILYADLLHTFEGLEDSEAGELIKHMLRYVNDMDPVAPNKLIKIAFEPIKQQLKRDLVKWEGIKEKRSDAGKASADKRKQEATKSTSVEQKQQVSTNSTVTVNDTVNVNVTDTVNDIYIGGEKDLEAKKVFKEKKIYKQINSKKYTTIEWRDKTLGAGFTIEQIDAVIKSMAGRDDNAKYKDVEATLTDWLIKNRENAQKPLKSAENSVHHDINLDEYLNKDKEPF
jgi:hypothetical protein